MEVKLTLISRHENTIKEDEFERLYVQYKDFLKNYLLSFERYSDEPMVEDLVQDVFLRIWLLRQDLDSKGHIRAYIFKIGQNLMMDYFRKAKNRRLYESYEAKMKSHICVLNLEELFFECNMSQLSSVIRKLPPKRRKVFELCKLEGKSYAETAKLLKISPSTISDHIVKANSFLKAEVNRRFN